MKFLRRFHYNAPVTLTFCLVCLAALGLTQLSVDIRNLFFCTYRAKLTDPLMYVRLFGHSIGHSGWQHYINNMLYILMLGPMIEEKYGSKMMLEMMGITAVITGIIFNLVSPNSSLLGASGIVFMFIILSSISNAEKGRIPITFILVCLLFLGQEVLNAFRQDNISQLTHIVGGACGAFFGLFLTATGGVKKDDTTSGDTTSYQSSDPY